MAAIKPVLRASSTMAPMPPAERPWTRSPSS